jgi:protein SCO1/2
MSEAFRRLGPDAEKISALFISVDPGRDTPDKLKDYLQSFHPRISALTGTQAEIDAVTKAYKAYAKKVPLDGGEYTMDHTAIVYLTDREGRFVAPFNLKRPADEAAKDLRRYL